MHYIINTKVISLFIPAVIFFSSNATASTCENIKYDTVINKVINDLTKIRVPEIPKALFHKTGTIEPKLKFDKRNTKITDSYFIPFEASGPKGTRKYFAIYTCNSGKIEYSFGD